MVRNFALTVAIVIAGESVALGLIVLYQLIRRAVYPIGATPIWIQRALWRIFGGTWIVDAPRYVEQIRRPSLFWLIRARIFGKGPRMIFYAQRLPKRRRRLIGTPALICRTSSLRSALDLLDRDRLPAR